MAWNEPDNDDRKDDPWSNGPGGKDQGPPDIEELINNFVKESFRTVWWTRWRQHWRWRP